MPRSHSTTGREPPTPTPIVPSLTSIDEDLLDCQAQVTCTGWGECMTVWAGEFYQQARFFNRIKSRRAGIHGFRKPPIVGKSGNPSAPGTWS